MNNNPTVKVTVDDDLNGHLLIQGDTLQLLQDARARFYFKDYVLNEKNSILIPYEKNNKEKVIKDTEDKLSRLSISFNYSDNIREAEEGFIRAKESFNDFSQCAKKIRNNTFKDDDALMQGFNDFISVISNVVSERTLYKLQLLSAYHMAFSQNACNFSVPGAGKTTIVYAAYAYLKTIQDENKHVDNIIIIGPTAAFGPWEDEYEECFGKKPSIVKISEQDHDSRRTHFYSSHPAEVTIIGYQLLDRYQEDINHFLKKHRTMLVVDEAHYIKSIKGVWSKALLNFSTNAVSRIALTGTPAPNGYEDLYNLYRFILPFNYSQVLGMNYKRLREMTENGYNDEKKKEFVDRISPFFIRIKKTDLELPPIIDHPPIKVKMSKLQREIYDYIESRYIKSFQNKNDKDFKSKLCKAKIIRLRQAATNPDLLSKPLEEYYADMGYTNSLGINDEGILKEIRNYKSKETPEKFIALINLTKEILSKKPNEKVIIWSQFILNSKQIRSLLIEKGIETELLIGEVDKPERREIIKRFNDPNDTSFRVVIAHPRAVGESISLHKGCQNAIYLDMDYNAASYIQSKDRIHRVLKPLPKNLAVHYYSIISEESIDNIITERVSHKVSVMEKTINEDIPLFVSNGIGDNDDDDNTNIIKELIDDYIKRHSR